MPEEMPKNESITGNTFWDQKTDLEKIDILAKRISAMDHAFEDRLDRLIAAQQENTQVLRTVMVGWNAFLKSAESQLRGIFKGNIPAPILRRLIESAFKGIDEVERKRK